MKKSKVSTEASIDFARLQRRMSSDYVLTVWRWVRNRQVYGQKFRREHPVKPYTVDFFCVELGLVIEIDGSHHLTPDGCEHDRIRDRYMKSLGYQILRIPGYEILRDAPSVHRLIKEFVSRAMKASGKLPTDTNRGIF